MNSGKKLSPAEVANKLRERIQRGELRVGHKLPTQAQLVQEYGVERGTVRQALRQLQEDGLLSHVSKGSPPRVAEPRRRPPEKPPSAMAGLAPRLVEAFSEPHVRIDAACLTAETLMWSMDAPMRLIERGEVRPRSVSARIVLPPKELKRHYPAPFEGWGHDKRVDDAVHGRSIKQHERQITVLEGQFRIIRDVYEIPASVEFRAGDGTPFNKLYLLNDAEVLFAYYIIGEKKKEDVDGLELELRDARGTESPLFSFHARQGERDQLFVQTSREWFDALWETLSPVVR